MDASDYLRIITRRWPAIVVVGVIGAILGLLSAPAPHRAPLVVRPKAYSATFTLALNPSAVASAGGGGSVTSTTPNLQSMAFLTTAGDVPKQAAQKLGYNGAPPLLATKIQATPNTTVGTLQIVATDGNAARAVALANAFATSLMSYLTSVQQKAVQDQIQGLTSSMNEVQTSIAILDAQISGQQAPPPSHPPVEILQAQRSAYSQRYEVLFNQFLSVEHAGPAISPLVTLQEPVAIPIGATSTSSSKIPSSRTARAALGLVLGLLMGGAGAIGIDLLDPRIRSRDAAERVFGLPVLAEIRASRNADASANLVVARQPSSVDADAYRVLRAMLLLGARPLGSEAVTTAGGDGADGADGAGGPVPVAHKSFQTETKLGVLLVTAAEEGQGTSAVVANIAACFAEAGRSVLVLSADFRRPSVHRYLGVRAAPGLSDLMASRHLRTSEVVSETTVPGVHLIPSGTPLPNEIQLLSRRAAEVVAEARPLADVVIVDAPALTGVSDASELIPSVDGVLLVCRQGQARVALAKRTAELIERASAPVVGLVFVTTDPRLLQPHRPTSERVRSSAASSMKAAAASSPAYHPVAVPRGWEDAGTDVAEPVGRPGGAGDS